MGSNQSRPVAAHLITEVAQLLGDANQIQITRDQPPQVPPKGTQPPRVRRMSMQHEDDAHPLERSVIIRLSRADNTKLRSPPPGPPQHSQAATTHHKKNNDDSSHMEDDLEVVSESDSDHSDDESDIDDWSPKSGWTQLSDDFEDLHDVVAHANSSVISMDQVKALQGSNASLQESVPKTPGAGTSSPSSTAKTTSATTTSSHEAANASMMSSRVRNNVKEPLDLADGEAVLGQSPSLITPAQTDGAATVNSQTTATTTSITAATTATAAAAAATVSISEVTNGSAKPADPAPSGLTGSVKQLLRQTGDASLSAVRRLLPASIAPASKPTGTATPSSTASTSTSSGNHSTTAATTVNSEARYCHRTQLQTRPGFGIQLLDTLLNQFEADRLQAQTHAWSSSVSACDRIGHPTRAAASSNQVTSTTATPCAPPTDSVSAAVCGISEFAGSFASSLLEPAAALPEVKLPVSLKSSSSAPAPAVPSKPKPLKTRLASIFACNNDENKDISNDQNANQRSVNQSSSASASTAIVVAPPRKRVRLPSSVPRTHHPDARATHPSRAKSLATATTPASHPASKNYWNHKDINERPATAPLRLCKPIHIPPTTTRSVRLRAFTNRIDTDSSTPAHCTSTSGRRSRLGVATAASTPTSPRFRTTPASSITASTSTSNSSSALTLLSSAPEPVRRIPRASVLHKRRRSAHSEASSADNNSEHKEHHSDEFDPESLDRSNQHFSQSHHAYSSETLDFGYDIAAEDFHLSQGRRH